MELFLMDNNIFKQYILATFSDDYPIERDKIFKRSLVNNPISTLFDQNTNLKKEIIFQQSKFLEIAQNYLDTNPQITFVAVQKHSYLLDCINLDSASFDNISDKEYFFYYTKIF